ncbi:MAG: hypothetical protein IJ589_06070 [Lachnospiraceae bacterium]|nr:hypothetical protein [Lachnospiraceae bacterium]
MSRTNNLQTNSNSMEQSVKLSYGLFLSGTVIDRTRRRVPKDNPTTEIVTYTLSDDNEKKYFVDDYAPDHYYNLGAYVSLPVYVKPYQKKNHDISYNLCVQKQASSLGEHF